MLTYLLCFIIVLIIEDTHKDVKLQQIRLVIMEQMDIDIVIKKIIYLKMHLRSLHQALDGIHDMINELEEQLMDQEEVIVEKIWRSVKHNVI